MAVKHISDKNSHALCGIKVRTGADRWDNNGKPVCRGGVDNVGLVEITYETQLGMSGVLCRRCVKKWKQSNEVAKYEH